MITMPLARRLLDYDAVQIYDDYNEPIGQPIKPNEDEDQNERMENDSDSPDSENEDNEEGPMEEQAEDDSDQLENQSNNDQPPKDIPIEKGSNEPIKQHHKRPQSNNNFRSLLVKVYRGPTKQINEKPFASWGYFVKYPSEDNVPPSKQ